MRIVFLTGAGISAESGLKTFRDSDGLWEGHSVEDVASIEGWNRNPQKVLDFYNQRRRDVKAAEPNQAHKIIGELSRREDVFVITQNVDDLHEKGGIPAEKIIHLHGDLQTMRSSEDNDLIYPYQDDIKLGDLAEDGSQLRPNIVWFGEQLSTFELAEKICKKADLFVVVGTSLCVFPAASLAYRPKMSVQRFLVDPSPNLTSLPGVDFTVIRKPATSGMNELLSYLV